MKAFVRGIVLGLALGGILGALASSAGLASHARELQGDWAPVAVLVLTRDLAAGEKLSDGDLAEAKLPIQYVSNSLVAPRQRPEVAGRALGMPLRRGDALRWVAFVNPREIDACIDANLASFRGEAATALAGAVDEFKRNVVTRPAPPLPAPERGADGMVEVVALSRDVEAGHRLERSDLEVRRIPAALATRSVVPASELERVVGSTTPELLKGDALRWQFLDDGDHPQTFSGCVMQVDGRTSSALAETAKRLAKAHFERGSGGH